MGLKLIEPATDTIVSLDDAKAHLHVDFTDDDDLIEALIAAAVAYAEGPRGCLARALADQTWDYYLDRFPDHSGSVHYHRHGRHHHSNLIEIPLPPLIEVEGIFYRTDAGADEMEWDASNYTVDDASEPARIGLVSGKCWPSLCPGLNLVRIRFRAGYLDNSSPPVFALPGAIKAGLLLHIGTLYENREDTVIGSTVASLPFGAQCLYRPYIAQRGFA